MKKVQTIINQLDSQSIQYKQLPRVSHVLESDIDRLSDALKKQKNDRSYYAILRVILSDVKKSLGHKDYSKPLLEISLSQLQGKQYINELKIKICQSIIECQQDHKVNIVEHNVNTLTQLNLRNPVLKARLEIIRAGKQYLKGDYIKAAMLYLSSSREQALIKDEIKKLQLINKSIAFCYIAPKNAQTHKIICTLCLNELTKKSHLAQTLNKLYTKDMITSQDSKLLEKQLPQSLNKPDIDGVSVLSKAKFSHNMVPILNAFKCIQLSTLTHLLGLNIDETLILLEKIYCNGEIKIDQQKDLIDFTIDDNIEMQERKKQFLNKIDDILTIE